MLRGLKARKAVGIDDIPARLVKDAADVVTRPSSNIINTSLQSGRVPNDWKAARVIPLLKKGKLRLWIITGQSLFCLYFCKSQGGPYIFSYFTICRNTRSWPRISVVFANATRLSLQLPALLILFVESWSRSADRTLFINMRKVLSTVDCRVLLGKLSDMGINCWFWARVAW